MPKALRLAIAAFLVAGTAHAQAPTQPAPRAGAPSPAGAPRAPGGGGRPPALAGASQFGGARSADRPGGFDRGRGPGGAGFDPRRFGGGGGAPADAGRIGVRRFGDEGAPRFGGPGRPGEPTPLPGPRVYRFGGGRLGGGESFPASPTQVAPGRDVGRDVGRTGFGGRDGRARGVVGPSVGGLGVSGPGVDGRGYRGRGFDGRGFDGGADARPGYDGRGPRADGFDRRGRDHARFRVSPYRFPRGFRYRTYSRGEFFPRGLLLSPYFLDDYSDFQLSPPPGPDYRWVRYGPDALLVDVDTGEVVDQAYGVFDDGQAYGSGVYPDAGAARRAYGDAWDGNGYDAPSAYDGRGYDAAPEYGPDDAYPQGS